MVEPGGCGRARPRDNALKSCDLTKGSCRIGEPLRVEPTSSDDDRLELLDDVEDVDVHGGGDDAVAVPEGDEFAIVEAAADDEGVAGVGVADILMPRSYWSEKMSPNGSHAITAPSKLRQSHHSVPHETVTLHLTRGWVSADIAIGRIRN
jgi:hypothetical protein